MGSPPIARLLMVELPLLAAPSACEACAITRSAVIPIPATVMFRFESEASDATCSAQLIADALSVSPVTPVGRLPTTIEASRESFTPERVPVEPSAVVIPRVVVLIALALPVTDDAVVDGGVSVGIGTGVGIGGGVGKIPPSCATLAAGDIKTAAANAIASEQR